MFEKKTMYGIVYISSLFIYSPSLLTIAEWVYLWMCFKRINTCSILPLQYLLLILNNNEYFKQIITQGCYYSILLPPFTPSLPPPKKLLSYKYVFAVCYGVKNIWHLSGRRESYYRWMERTNSFILFQTNQVNSSKSTIRPGLTADILK